MIDEFPSKRVEAAEGFVDFAEAGEVRFVLGLGLCDGEGFVQDIELFEHHGGGLLCRGNAGIEDGVGGGGFILRFGQWFDQFDELVLREEHFEFGQGNLGVGIAEVSMEGVHADQRIGYLAEVIKDALFDIL